MSNQDFENLNDQNFPLRRMSSMIIMIAICLTVSLGPLLLRSMENADIWQILFYRSVFWFSALLTILIYRFRYNLLKNIFAIGKWGVFAGLFLSGAQLFYIQALSNTSVANVTFMLSATPFITALVGYIFLREKLKKFTLFMMIFAGLGIYIMVFHGIKSGNSFGNIMAILTALCFACFPVILRKFRSIDMLPTLLVPATIIGIIGIGVKGNDLIISNNDILLCFIWGCIINGFAHTFFIAVTRHLLAAEITLFMLLEFILSPVWVWVFIGEIPHSNTFFGGFFVIFAIFMITSVELFSNKGFDKQPTNKNNLENKKILTKGNINQVYKKEMKIEDKNLKTQITSEAEKIVIKEIKIWIDKKFSVLLKENISSYFRQKK